jgi:hypothetical protein
VNYKPVEVRDILDIQDLLARYCFYFDENRFEDWARLYTEDGVFEGLGQTVKGRAALEEIPKATFATSGGSVRHQYGNLMLEHGLDDNDVTARFYNQVIDWSDGGKLSLLAICTAQLVRTKEGWKIRRNTMDVKR